MSVSSPPIRTILVLAATPQKTTALRLDQQVRDIDESLRRAKCRDCFVLEQRWSVRSKDIQRSILEVKPQIVQFSGQGEGDAGLIVEDDIGNQKCVDGEALAGLFQLVTEHVECVILNACYSEVQARCIVRHIPYVIGMKCEIGDRAALTFSRGFYDALGAGYDIEFAYKCGCSSIRMAGIQEYLTPVLLKGDGSSVSAKQTTFHSRALPSWEKQQLAKDQVGLQQEYEVLSTRIQRLNQALAIETDVTIRFKYEQVIQQDQLKRDLVLQQIRKISRQL